MFTQCSLFDYLLFAYEYLCLLFKTFPILLDSPKSEWCLFMNVGIRLLTFTSMHRIHGQLLVCLMIVIVLMGVERCR